MLRTGRCQNLEQLHQGSIARHGVTTRRSCATPVTHAREVFWQLSRTGGRRWPFSTRLFSCFSSSPTRWAAVRTGTTSLATITLLTTIGVLITDSLSSVVVVVVVMAMDSTFDSLVNRKATYVFLVLSVPRFIDLSKPLH